MPLLSARVTDIGEYIRHRSCQRRLRLAHENRALYAQLPFARRPFHVLDPVLMEAGKRREEQWATTLRDAGFKQLHHPSVDEVAWHKLRHGLESLAAEDRAFAREVALDGRIGAFSLTGRIDFIVILWREGQPVLRLVECKASRRDRTYHRIQVVLYKILLEQQLQRAPVVIAGKPLTTVECVVARIDEANGQLQPIVELEPFPQVEALSADARSLLAEGGTLAQILASDLDSLAFQLEGKCDDCTFSAHCFAESARQRRLELLGSSPATTRTLREAGIHTLDDLAELSATSEARQRLRTRGGLDQHLEDLQVQAKARRATLPGGLEEHPVLTRPFVGKGQLPAHSIAGTPLVRVYLSVSYDYVENRVVALAAHVTNSAGEVVTPFAEVDGKPSPAAGIGEQQVTFQKQPDGGYTRTVGETQELCGIDILRVQSVPWSGLYEQDTGCELQLLQGFFREVVEAVCEVADTARAPVHFYVWSRSEMTRLLEACSRAGSGLLQHLRELLGCRESLEQLIFSVVQDEVFNRYALGYTSRGLTVATAVSWFGQRYHWLRKVGFRSREVDLGQVFLRDIFDFRARLGFRAGTPTFEWADDTEAEASDVVNHRFEVRGRFHDNLSAPYIHAFWGTLPSPEEVRTPRVGQALADYHQAAKPGHLKAYLAARVHALRWLEERVPQKNREIEKPAITLANLPRFSLNTQNVADAAVDFLRLDHHIKVQDWLRAHLVPPITRVARGQSLPLRDLRVESRAKPGKRRKDGRPYTETVVVATIDTRYLDESVQTLATRVGLGEGDFVRLTRASNDPREGQGYGDLTFGKTCIIKKVDWTVGELTLSLLFGKTGKRYVLPSFSFEPRSSDARRHPFAYATLDRSVSDFVADRVETRLRNEDKNPLYGQHILAWFDPVRPTLPPMRPLPPTLEQNLRTLLQGLRIGAGKHPLKPRRVDVIVEGMQHRLQLVQGPPGTGKTMLTSIAVLARVLGLHGTGTVILVAANTHTAVDTLLLRIAGEVERFTTQAEAVKLRCPQLTLAKLISNDDPPPEGLQALNPNTCLNQLKTWRKTSTVIIGGTSSALLKMVERGLNSKAAFQRQSQGFQTPLLVVDEASMMVFSHFLALATLVEADGQIMLAGDHRQLSPILAHDWESEDRPPAVLYKPFVSAYEAVDRMPKHPATICTHKLTHTYRLPPVIRRLIQPLYLRDGIELTGPEQAQPQSQWDGQDPWQAVWQSGHRLYLVVHNESRSEHQNPTEVDIIANLLRADPTPKQDAIAIVTPHRSQRALLRERLAGDSVDLIDTVERLQGGERPTIVFSATESDPIVIHQRVEFILNLNRSNVAFSRTQERLIVVCAQTLLEHVPTEAEQYESALLWKHLRAMCPTELAGCEVNGANVRIFGG